MNNEESILALLGESLHKHHSPIVINFNSFNAPIGQHNDHVDTVNFTMDKDGGFSFQHVREIAKETMPPDVLMKAVEQTVSKGLWWASTAWAVVYRVYQIEGYSGSIKQFVREVADWPFEHSPEYECSYDAVCKPIRSGKLTGLPSTWVQNGAMAQYAILGEALLKEFQ